MAGPSSQTVGATLIGAGLRASALRSRYGAFSSSRERLRRNAGHVSQSSMVAALASKVCTRGSARTDRTGLFPSAGGFASQSPACRDICRRAKRYDCRTRRLRPELGDVSAKERDRSPARRLGSRGRSSGKRCRADRRRRVTRSRVEVLVTDVLEAGVVTSARRDVR